MRKIQTALLAFAAVCAFGVVLASSASAEITLLAEWLHNGAAVIGPLATTSTGGITLENTSLGFAVLCTATVDGTVSENGADETKEILNAVGTAVGVGGLAGKSLLGTGAASGEGSECATVKACAAGSTTSPIEVWPLGLPWTTTLYLMEDGKFLDLIVGTGEIGYEILCLILGINTEDKCTSATNDFDIEVINNAAGDAVIPALAHTTPNGLCTSNNGETGVNEADAETAITLNNGELLSVSSV